MRPIHLVRLDKTRPAVVLTRELARGSMTSISVAPITSTIRGLSTEVALGSAHGLDGECVVSCDNVQTVPASSIGRQVGYLLERDESALAQALVNAFDLRVEDL